MLIFMQTFFRRSRHFILSALDHSALTMVDLSPIFLPCSDSFIGVHTHTHTQTQTQTHTQTHTVPVPLLLLDPAPFQTMQDMTRNVSQILPYYSCRILCCMDALNHSLFHIYLVLGVEVLHKEIVGRRRCLETVSYTHLTLPTIYSV